MNSYFLAVNHTIPRLQDPRVRLALSHVLDKDANVESVLAGAWQVATRPIHPFLGDYYNPNVATYAYDPGAAAQLLTDAGWTKRDDGHPRQRGRRALHLPDQRPQGLSGPRAGDRVSIVYKHLPPSGEHLLGTDESGRDVFSRLVVGARAAIAVGLTAMVISILIGSLVGSLAGFFGGVPDTILIRITDGMMAIPYFFLVLIVVAVFGSSFTNVVIVISVTSWMVVARIVRSDVLRFRANEFVTAARSIGAGDARFLLRHILSHAIPSILVAATPGVARAILLKSTLSFLGLGIQPPTASWGNTRSNPRACIRDYPLLPLYPGVLVLLTVLAFNFLGDALCDALDPQYRDDGH